MTPRPFAALTLFCTRARSLRRRSAFRSLVCTAFALAAGLPTSSWAQDAAEAVESADAVSDTATDAAAPATQPANIDPDLVQTLLAADLNYQALANGDVVVPVRLSADSDRVLPVFVTSRRAEFVGRSYRAMFAASISQDGPIDPGFTDQALAQNLNLIHGGWALRTDENGRSTLLFKVPVPVETDPGQFRELLRSVASVAVRQRAVWLGEDPDAADPSGPASP
ncbi:MAG: hypothetical protein AAF288_01040 [Planctomycetota bacterium]